MIADRLRKTMREQIINRKSTIINIFRGEVEVVEISVLETGESRCKSYHRDLIFSETEVPTVASALADVFNAGAPGLMIHRLKPTLPIAKPVSAVWKSSIPNQKS